MQTKPIIESVRDFIVKCDLLKKNRVNVDYIGAEMSYSIDPLPCNPIVKAYSDGEKVKQFLFAFTSKEAYDSDARTGIENSGFLQRFEEWIEQKNRLNDFPILTSEKQIPTSISVEQSGYLYDTESDKAQYQIQCKLEYEQEV